MRWMLLVCLLGFYAPLSSAADDAAIVALIGKMEHERIAAGLRKDVAALDATTADDYRQIGIDGQVRDKATVMKRIGAPESTVKVTANVIDDLVIRVYGDTVVVTGRATPTGTIDGKPYPRTRYSRVYVRRDNVWKVVLFQMTPL